MNRTKTNSCASLGCLKQSANFVKWKSINRVGQDKILRKKYCKRHYKVVMKTMVRNTHTYLLLKHGPIS